MAAQFPDSIDLGGTQLLNALLQQLGTDITPSTANKGRAYYHTGTNLAKISNGSAIDTITNILESVSAPGGNGLSVAAVSGKNQAISLALANSGTAGAMSTGHYSLVNGATSANTASTLVQRDASGNFTAGTISAALTGTASNATQLNNQAASFYTNFANTTGQRTATSAISDFDTQVRTSRLDQMAAPTAAVAYNAQRITGVADPTSAQDAATKNYVDSVATGLDFKASVRVATTAGLSGITYTATAGASGRGQITGAPNAVDGVNLAAGNRVLVKNETNAASRGIYVVSTLGTGANGVWDRASDFDQDAEVTSGAFTFVEEGATNQTTSWVLATVNPITIGGSSGTGLAFSQFGGGTTYSNGNGLNLSGGQFSVRADTTTVNPNSISVSGTGVTIATTYVGQTSITTLGTVTTGVWNGTAVAIANGGTGATTAAAALANLGGTRKFVQTLTGSATSYTVPHNFNTRAVTYSVRDTATNALSIFPTVVATDANNLTVSFSTAPTSGAYEVTVVG